MGGRHSLLEKIYERNPQNGNYIIEVSLDTYADIFNEWDHAPMKRKDIDPDLLRFLEDSIDDIPRKNNIDISFYLSAQEQSAEKEQAIITWFRTYYRLCIELERKKIQALVRQSVIFMLVSAVLLASSYLGEQIGENNLSYYLLTEIAIVGGWVFLWEAISRLTFDRAKIRRLIQGYGRFARADIFFRYPRATAPGTP